MAIVKTDVYNVQAPFPLDLRDVVGTLNDRDAIGVAQRYEGLPVYVTTEQKVYRLVGGTENEDWVQVWPFGGNGSVTINTAAPTGGTDGDIWFRQESTNVRVYQKIAGAWTDLGIFSVTAPIPTIQQVLAAGNTTSIPFTNNSSVGINANRYNILGATRGLSWNNEAETHGFRIGVGAIATNHDFDGQIGYMASPGIGYWQISIRNSGGVIPNLRALAVSGRVSGEDAVNLGEFATLRQVGKTFLHTASGDGTSTTFSVAHGLTYAPTMVIATPNSPDSAGSFYADISGNDVVITCGSAPVAGTNNLKWTILVK